ncbi:unnamed protein product [Lasius platythorax]|uniref:Uncharacterized protein n=1 Tax=Lasius platythorax TaxID=488582 RepID=A0AAV2P1K8_9HYME
MECRRIHGELQHEICTFAYARFRHKKQLANFSARENSLLNVSYSCRRCGTDLCVTVFTGKLLSSSANRLTSSNGMEISLDSPPLVMPERSIKNVNKKKMEKTSSLKNSCSALL